jgi:hypothetical protein
MHLTSPSPGQLPEDFSRKHYQIRVQKISHQVRSCRIAEFQRSGAIELNSTRGYTRLIEGVLLPWALNENTFSVCVLTLNSIMTSCPELQEQMETGDKD